MSRMILLIFAGISLLTGIYIFSQPNAFYEMVPGLDLMGPFSIHFIRDVALAFLASGGAIAWGAWNSNRAVAIAGVAWPLLHAIFHIQIWGMRGFPLDHIAAFNWAAAILPPIVAAWACSRLESS